MPHGPWRAIASELGEPRAARGRTVHVSVEVANLVVAAALAGLIWTIQLVHYPLFALVGAREWPHYEAEHQRRITRLVAPLMLANVGLALALFAEDPSASRVLNAGLAIGIFVATGFLFAPMHRRLKTHAGTRAVRLLVRANWARTAAWTAQVFVAMLLI
jgi:hypothetical protein